ncbi:MAG: peptidoglycan DD-metalloendopeptidase family protein [Deltaproteobacteria bacterium]|nr:peptidoglycan DD-metalloendopeptidase family protein [Deltaproteobacteria bacterium]
MAVAWPSPSSFSSQQKLINERIGETKAEIERLTMQEKDLAAELEAVQKAAAQAEARVRKTEKAIREVNASIRRNQKELAAIEASLPGLCAAAGKRLAAYYRLGRTGTAPVLFSADSVYGMAVRQRALSHILEADARLFSELAQKQEDLVRTRRDLRRKKQELTTLKADLAEELAARKQQRAQKQELLALIRQDRDLAAAALKSLQEAAERLAETLAAREGRGEGTRGGLPALKGLLPFPVEGGEVAEGFGPFTDPATGTTQFRSGIRIQAKAGDLIRAVHKGRVAYAGWFSGYGNMMIIDHGDGYFTVCAHAEDLFKKEGDPVESGEVVGTVGDTGSLSGPGLYFELRHHQKPLDPGLWLRKGS